jgi:predicted DNA repair protein MutK
VSGLLALLDDVATIAKVAAASVDDVAGMAVKAGSKTAGVIIDDAAVTPRYVTGFSADRELPIIGKIALGSLRNKMFILLPAALLLNAFAPFMITPLLMLGGAYLCFEGAEKVWHLFAGKAHHAEESLVGDDPLHLERERVAGAIKTDFILSAEIMTIALAAIPKSSFIMEAVTLAAVGIGITGLVYGGVALIVKADDVGLHMHELGRLGATRALGRGIVRAMPRFLALLSTVGTLAMLWVGGSIIVHGLEELGVAGPEHLIAEIAAAAAGAVDVAPGLVGWLARATLDGLFGLVLGLVLILPGTKIIAPLWARLSGASKA